MIDKTKLIDFIESQLSESDYFLVDVVVSTDNCIRVEIDHLEGVNIDYCVELTRAIEAEFDREEEDYELEVGSAGLTSPFKVKGQYLKYVGKEVEVLAADGKKYKGTLDQVDEDSFTIICDEKVKKEGAKRPVVEQVPHQFMYNQVKSTKYLLQF